MLYANYVRNKMRHLYKTAEAEGVPCILKYSKGKYMKDYEIYGNSVQGKNLIPYPFYQETKTINGVTFTNNGDGTITANGTATANAVYYLYYNSTEQTRMNISDIAIISGCPESETTNYGVSFDIYYEDGSRHYYTDYGYSNTQNISAEKGKLNSCYILVKSGVTVENLIFKPQLELGSTATEWQSPAVSPENPVEIQSVGDLTKNLIPYPYTHTTTTIKGITFIDNGDGSITIDGTATDNAVFYLVDRESNYTLDKCGLNIGDSYTISKTLISGDSMGNIYFTANYYNTSNSMKAGASISNINTATETIQSDFVKWGIYLLVLKDKTVNNTTIKLQLEKGSLATEYEPYHKYDIPITVAGKNLIPYPYMYTTKTENGVTWTDNGDGSVTVSGTATGYSDFIFKIMSIAPNTTFTFSKNQSDDAANIAFILKQLDENRVPVGTEINLIPTVVTHTFNTVENARYIQIACKRYGNFECKGTYKPMLEIGDTATEYEPYRGIETTHIYLDEPLRKVGDYSDYVDFKKQKVVRNIKEITLNGSENWRLQGTNENGIISFICSVSNETAPSTINIPALSTHFTCRYDGFSNATEQGFFVQRGAGNTNIYIRMLNEEIANITAFKTWLSENNVTIYYQMATPTEEPISLPTLQTFKGTTIMSVDTTVLPSNIKVTYVRT